MNINELKGALGTISAPDQLNYKSQKSMENSSNFIGQLKKADARSKTMVRRFYITYFVIAAIYFGIFILNPDPDLIWLLLAPGLPKSKLVGLSMALNYGPVVLTVTTI